MSSLRDEQARQKSLDKGTTEQREEVKLQSELEKRGHKFVRYADDCNIYVKTPRAGERVMESVREFLEKKLKLKVNPKKSKVDKAQRVKFLGFSFYKHKGERLIRVANRSLE